MKVPDWINKQEDGANFATICKKSQVLKIINYK